MAAFPPSTMKMTPQDEAALRKLAGRALHRPTDLGMKEVAALASAVIAFLEPKKGEPASAKSG